MLLLVNSGSMNCLEEEKKCKHLNRDRLCAINISKIVMCEVGSIRFYLVYVQSSFLDIEV